MSLADILAALPDALQDCLQSFEEKYSAAIEEAKNDRFVIVAGRAGSGKSMLINAVSGAFSMLSSCGSIISHTMVPTRIRASVQKTDKFTLRIVHAVHDGSWHKIRNQALERLQVAITAEDDSPLISYLKDQAIMNVLRSVYPTLNPDCDEVFQWALIHLPNALLFDPSETAQNFIDKLTQEVKKHDEDNFEIDGVKRFCQESMSEQVYTDLSAEQAALLLRLMGHNHSTDIEVLELLMCRYLMSHPKAEVDAKPMILQFQKLDAGIDADALLTSFQVARTLAGKGIVFPSDILNLWPLIQYFELSGPFELPAGVVVVDTAGSQDSNQLNDPLECAKNSTRCKNPCLWYLVDVHRAFSLDSAFSEVPNINRLFNWNEVNFLITMDDESESKKNVEEEVRAKIAARLVDNRERAEKVKVFRVSSRAFAALEDPQNFEDEIGSRKLRLYKNKTVSTGITELRQSLSRPNEDDAKVHADYAEKLAGVLDFTQNLDENVTETPELEYLIDNLSQLQIDAPRDARTALKLVLDNYKRTSTRSCEHVRTSTFIAELKKRLEDELKEIPHYTQLQALINGQGDFDMYARQGNKSKQFRLAKWLGNLVDQKPAVHDNLAEAFTDAATQEIEKFIAKAKASLEESKKVLETKKEDGNQKSQLFRILQAQSFFSTFRDIRTDLARQIQLPIPESTAAGLENKAALRDEYVAMWSRIKILDVKGLESKRDVLGGYLMTHLPDILFKTLVRIQNLHVNAMYSAFLALIKSFLENVDKDWQLILKMEPASLKIPVELHRYLQAQLAAISKKPIQNQCNLSFRVTKVSEHSTETMLFLNKRRKLQPSSEETKTVVMEGDGLISRNSENEPRIVQRQGQKYLLLFRGLCAAVTDEMHFGGSRESASEAKDDDFVSSMGQSVQDALKDQKYYRASGFVMVEHQLRKRLRKKSAQNRKSLSEAEEEKEIDDLGQEIRNDILQCSVKNFSSLVETIGARSTPRCHSLAYFNSKKTDFESFRYVTQQIYSNDDLQFMKAYASVAKEVFNTAKDTELNITALIDRAAALNDTVRGRKRFDYLKLEAWSWLGKVKYLLPRHPCAPYLHGNPYISLTDNLQHAMRYATGQKKYMQGQEQQLALDLPYGWNEQTQKYKWENAYELPPSKARTLMGMLILVLVPESYYNLNNTAGFCNNVPALHHNGKLLIKKRILWEREVTFVGCLPSDTITHAWPIPLLPLSIEKCPTEWVTFYNIGSEDEGCFDQLKKAVSALVKARATNQSTFTLLGRAREAVVTCLMRRVKADLPDLIGTANDDDLFQ